MDLIDVFGIEFNNNSEKVDQISFLKLGRRKIRVKNCGFPPLDGSQMSANVRPVDMDVRRLECFSARYQNIFWTKF